MNNAELKENLWWFCGHKDGGHRIVVSPERPKSSMDGGEYLGSSYAFKSEEEMYVSGYLLRELCSICGDYIKLMGDNKERMKELSLCWMCDQWHAFRKIPKNQYIIGSYLYEVGPEPRTDSDRHWLGMAGRKFAIKPLDYHPEFITHNLWALGAVPKHFLPRFPDTATFVGGAKKSNAGGTICWDSSQ